MFLELLGVLTIVSNREALCLCFAELGQHERIREGVANSCTCTIQPNTPVYCRSPNLREVSFVCLKLVQQKLTNQEISSFKVPIISRLP